MKSQSPHAPALRFWPLAVLAALAGCSGPVATRSGMAGPPIAPGALVALAPEPEGAGAAHVAARAAVAEALGRHGYRVAGEAPLTVEVAIAERAAEVAVRPLAGPPLSPAKAPRLLQDCRDRTHRLTLALHDPARPGLTRVWAEEHHCKGTLAASLPALAEQAATALALAEPSRQTERAGKD